MLSKKAQDDIFSTLKVRDHTSSYKCQEMIDNFNKESENLSTDQVKALFKTTFNLDPGYMDY